MPEEKKDKKVVAAGAEGAKKDSFTFSDKIKNSKPAASKSFANRISSKIGSDGKPRKTLFERTKRDAPFFIAAIVALLLLPFLYKYSGSVEDSPAIVTPGEEVPFNPDARSGFDSIGDPEGQIAQVSGRDSMDLIVGFGSKKTEEEDPFRYDQFDRSGMDDTSFASANNRDEEYNTRNEYRIRKKAPAATRAAFKKTPIGSLRSAGLASRSGGKLGVGMWGGGLKQAANKVKGDAPKSSPKPVSLQPLQAAGKPSRSYFGQGAAAEARRSKDAMSKANAMQALMDAQMKPVEPGKIGGIAGGDFGGPGGGNGNLDRKFAFNGKEPWWWDMMKKRSQMEWEAKFNRKWDWIKFGDKLAQQFLNGFVSCLLAGTDDWSMGKFGAGISGAGSDDECCGYNEDKWKYKYPGLPLNEDACKAKKDEIAHNEGKEGCGWKAGKKSSSNLNFFQVRWDCLTNGAFAARKARKAGEGVVQELSDCADFYSQGRYFATVGGNYSLYHYVVGVDRADWNNYINASANDERYKLAKVIYFWSGGGFSIDPNTPTQWMNQRDAVPLFVESVAIKNKKIRKESGTVSDTEEIKEIKKRFNEELKYQDFLNILRKGGAMFDREESDAQGLLLSAKGGKEGAGKDWVTGARCAYPLAFASCHNEAILQAEDSVGEQIDGVPAAFVTFPNIGREKDGKNFYEEIQKLFFVTYKLDDRLNKDAGTVSYYANTYPSVKDYADASMRGVAGTSLSSGTVYNVAPAFGSKGEQAVHALMADKSKSATITWEVRQCWDPLNPWSYGRAMQDGACGRGMTGRLKEGVEAKEMPGQIVSTATCVYGDDVTISARAKTCMEKHNDPNYSAECCQEAHADNYGIPGGWYWDAEAGQCIQRQSNPPVMPLDTDPQPPVVPQLCPDGIQTSQECCTGSTNPQANQYIWVDSNPQGQQCIKRTTRFASRFSWIPLNPTARKEVAPSSGLVVDPRKDNAAGLVSGNRDTQYCGANVGESIMTSKAALAFVTAVKTAYNKQSNVTPIYHNGNTVSTAEFVDALNVASSVGITQVSNQAVAELGRQMVLVSKDPHMSKWNSRYHNELGAFYVYIHPDAVLYPARYYGSTNTQDERFTPNSRTGVTMKYHYNNYTVKGGRSPRLGVTKYNDSVAEKVGPGFYPLKDLVTSIPFANNLQSCQNSSQTFCGNQSKAYKQAFSKLVDQSTEADGEACAQISGEMKVADVLKYVKKACEVGLNFKPNGAGGNNFTPSINNGSGGSQGSTIVAKKKQK